ncbi:MAG: MFS transporter [Chitinophagales bacterium]|nr:MFS transporter [Chitinophagales bacterium]
MLFQSTNPAYESLQIPNFRFFALSRLLVVAALEMMLTVMGWQVYDLTHDPLALGMIGLVEAVPFILVCLFSGYIIDTYNRHHIGLFCLLLILLLLGGLFAVNHWGFGWAQQRLVLFYYTFIFALGLVRGFLNPAYTSLLPFLVERRLYANAVSWNSNAWQLAAVGGPALGGLLYGFGGASLAYGTMVVFVFLSLVLFARIRYISGAQAVRHEPILQSLREGVKFIFSHPILLGASALDMFAVLFGGAVALLPMFAADVLHVGPVGLGFLRAAPFVGAILMGFYLAHYPPLHHSGKKLLLSVAAFGLCIIAFGLSANVYLSWALLFLGGAFDSINVVIRSTILQLSTPDSMRGRVSAFNGIFIGVSNEIGAFESGVAARFLGLVPSVVFGGSMTLLVVAAAYWLVPQFKQLHLGKWIDQQHANQAGISSNL